VIDAFFQLQNGASFPKVSFWIYYLQIQASHTSNGFGCLIVVTAPSVTFYVWSRPLSRTGIRKRPLLRLPTSSVRSREYFLDYPPPCFARSWEGRRCSSCSVHEQQHLRWSRGGHISTSFLLQSRRTLGMKGRRIIDAKVLKINYHGKITRRIVRGRCT